MPTLCWKTLSPNIKKIYKNKVQASCGDASLRECFVWLYKGVFVLLLFETIYILFSFLYNQGFYYPFFFWKIIVGLILPAISELNWARGLHVQKKSGEV